MQCPKCGSENTQRLKLIFECGTKEINTTGYTAGTGIGSLLGIRVIGNKMYNVVLMYKYAEVTKASYALKPDGWKGEYAPVVDYAIINSLVTCSGIKKMSPLDYQLYGANNSIIEQQIQDTSTIPNIIHNASGVVINYFCSQ